MVTQKDICEMWHKVRADSTITAEYAVRDLFIKSLSRGSREIYDLLCGTETRLTPDDVSQELALRVRSAENTLKQLCQLDLVEREGDEYWAY